MLGYVLNRFSFQKNEEKNLIGLTLYVKGSVVEYKDCMKFAFFVFFSLLLSLEIYMVFCALQVVSMASAEERKKYYLNWDTLNFHTITCNCFLYHFFFGAHFYVTCLSSIVILWMLRRQLNGVEIPWIQPRFAVNVIA